MRSEHRRPTEVGRGAQRRARTTQQEDRTAQQDFPIRGSLVATVDAARARLFWLEETDQPRACFRLREDEAFVHPQASVKQGDRYTDSFTASISAGSSTKVHAYDDHRQANEREERRRFAVELADELARVVKAHDVQKLVLVASHSEHSPLRSEVEKRNLNTDIHHCVGEFTKLTAPELHDVLHARELVP